MKYEVDFYQDDGRRRPGPESTSRVIPHAAGADYNWMSFSISP